MTQILGLDQWGADWLAVPNLHHLLLLQMLQILGLDQLGIGWLALSNLHHLQPLLLQIPQFLGQV